MEKEVKDLPKVKVKRSKVSRDLIAGAIANKIIYNPRMFLKESGISALISVMKELKNKNEMTDTAIEKITSEIEALLNKETSKTRKKEIILNVIDGLIEETRYHLGLGRSVNLVRLGTLDVVVHQGFGSNYVKFTIAKDLEKIVKDSTPVENLNQERIQKQKEVIAKNLLNKKKNNKEEKG